MRSMTVPALAAMCLAACGGQAPDKVADPGRLAEAPEGAGESRALELLWTTSGFEQPEGAALAPDGGYFISNIGPGPETELDGNGFVSKVNPDGTVAAAKFAEGLHAPAGMAVKDGVLWVADRDGVAMIDAVTGAARGKVAMPGAVFLNDLTVWNGDVLVSDSGTAKIHRATEGGGVDEFASSPGWGGINGILADGDRLLISTMDEGKLIEFRRGGAERLIATGMKDADGIGLLPGGGYLVSSWPGEIHHVSEDGKVTLLVDTRTDKILQNDLSVFGDVVIVPNWEPGTVTAWRISSE